MSDGADLTAKIRAAFMPRCLGSWPTPLDAAPELGAAAGLDELWLKREDRSAERYGGSKVRGLEFLLAGIPPGAVCVTMGGTGSTHCLATAVHAGVCGGRAVLAQFPQPDTALARATARAATQHAALVVRAASRPAFPVALLRAWRAAGRLGPRHWIPGGGAHPRAVLGHLLAVLELEGRLPRPPDAVVVPLGSGGTAAGLAAGLAGLAWPTRVIAVRVAPWLVANGWRTRWLARRAIRLLRADGIPYPVRDPAAGIRVVDGVGAGYGHPSPEGEAARALAAGHGLALDPTYGAKAFAILGSPALRDFRRVVFWHTFAPPPRPVLPSPPPPPEDRS